MKTILFESHATSFDNERGIASGHINTPLSSKGSSQARELGERHKTTSIDLICCSDLDRSRETAKIAFGDRIIPCVHDARLREWDYGRWNGASASEVEVLKNKYIHEPFPEGESLTAAVSRINNFIDELPPIYPVILIVGHRAVFYALEQRYTNSSLEDIVSKPWKWQPGWRYS